MNFSRVDNRIRAIPDRLCFVREHPFLASRYKLRVDAKTKKAAPMRKRPGKANRLFNSIGNRDPRGKPDGRLNVMQLAGIDQV
jgi:hypothetical protein